MLNVYMYIIYAYVCIYIYVRVYKVVNFLFVLRPLKLSWKYITGANEETQKEVISNLFDFIYLRF